jgi:glycosyltransferase involved in cell wall biosynthesis
MSERTTMPRETVPRRTGMPSAERQPMARRTLRTRRRPGPVFSIVIPLYNEEAMIGALGARLSEVMDEMDGSCEVILVDDGSEDATYPLLLELRAGDDRFKVIELSRNFGHQVAITAGLDVASGDAVMIMDGDLQHPPELLHEFIRLWRLGYDVVYGIQSERHGQSWLKRVTARGFYRVLRTFTRISAPPGAGDFRLVDRKALDAFRGMREGNRFIRGMWHWIGFYQVGVAYEPPNRFAGRSKYGLRKMTGLAADAILSFSNIPLRAALTVGVIVSFLSFAFGASAIVGALLGQHLVPGWASLIVLTSFVLGIQLIVLGVIGEYIGRIYDEVKRRPIYIVRNRHGLAGSGRPTAVPDHE